MLLLLQRIWHVCTILGGPVLKVFKAFHGTNDLASSPCRHTKHRKLKEMAVSICRLRIRSGCNAGSGTICHSCNHVLGSAWVDRCTVANMEYTRSNVWKQSSMHCGFKFWSSAMDKSFKLFDQVKFYTQPTNTIPQNALNDFQRDKGCWNARCFPFNACKVQRCRQHTMLFGFPCPSSRRLPMTWDWSVCVCGQ